MTTKLFGNKTLKTATAIKTRFGINLLMLKWIKKLFWKRIRK